MTVAYQQQLTDALQHFMDKHDYILLTLCMDVLNAKICSRCKCSITVWA